MVFWKYIMVTGQSRSAEKKETIYPIYVVFGQDRRRVWDKSEEVLEEALAGCERQVSQSSYDGDEASLAEVLDGLRTLPFLSPRRVVLVKDADKFISEHRQSLEKYLEEPCPTGVLVLVARSFPANTRLAKRARQIGQVYNCEQIKPRALAEFIGKYALEKHQVRLPKEAAELLIELAGEDTGLLYGEIDKLATYMADPEKMRTEITRADVEELVGHNRQYNVFNVIDARTGGDAGEALKRLDYMLGQDRNAQYQAVGAFAWHFRRLYQARLLSGQGVGDQEIARRLRIWPRPEQFMRQVKRFSIEELAGCLGSLMRIDLASKSGWGTVRTGLEKMIIQFCQTSQSVHIRTFS